MNKIKTADEFNKKYFDFLEEGHYGLAIDHETIVEYLDSEFQELIKIPGFKYAQIKSKFNWFCFYANGVSLEKRQEIEKKLKEIYERGKIPTAKEFLRSRAVPNANGKDDELFDRVSENDLIEFAKIHVTSALAAAAKEAKTKSEWYQSNECPDGFEYDVVDKESILKAYPNENIQ